VQTDNHIFDPITKKIGLDVCCICFEQTEQAGSTCREGLLLKLIEWCQRKNNMYLQINWLRTSVQPGKAGRKHTDFIPVVESKSGVNEGA